MCASIGRCQRITERKIKRVVWRDAIFLGRFGEASSSKESKLEEPVEGSNGYRRVSVGESRNARAGWVEEGVFCS